MSGMPSRRFVFEGFLPAGGKERRARLEALRAEERTVIFYEAPHHLRQTLSDLLETFGDRRLAMGRELTKRHEEMLQMKLSEAIAHYQDQEPRGEYVLILEGADPLAREREERARWEQMTLREHMALYSALPPKEAMKQVAKDRGVSKRDVYNGLLQEES